MARIDDLVTKQTGRDFRVIQLPELVTDRVEVVKAIVGLEIQTVNLVSVQLQNQVAKLSPFKWDTADERTNKLAVVRTHEKAIRKIWKEAVDESAPSNSMSSSDDSSHHHQVHMNDNYALRQLIELHHTNDWKGN
jgi:hypothetical protein